MKGNAAKPAGGSANIFLRAVRVAVRFAAMAAVFYVVAYEPIVPFFPVCWEAGTEGPVRHRLYGNMTDEFAQALNSEHFLEYRQRRVGNVIFMTLRDWIFGAWYPYSITTRAISRVLWHRHGVDQKEVFQRRVRLPEFDRHWPTCEAVREIAFVGGKWSREGPSPIWYKKAGMPRPRGFIDAEVPGWADGYPWLDPNESRLADLAMALVFGLGVGCLLATWRGSGMGRYLVRGASYAVLAETGFIVWEAFTVFRT